MAKGRKTGGRDFQKGDDPRRRSAEDDFARRRAREFGAEAVEVHAKNLTDEDPRVRHAAAEALLNRGYGKPTEQVDLSVTGNWSVKVCIE